MVSGVLKWLINSPLKVTVKNRTMVGWTFCCINTKHFLTSVFELKPCFNTLVFIQSVLEQNFSDWYQDTTFANFNSMDMLSCYMHTSIFNSIAHIYYPISPVICLRCTWYMYNLLLWACCVIHRTVHCVNTIATLQSRKHVKSVFDFSIINAYVLTTLTHDNEHGHWEFENDSDFYFSKILK